MTITAQNNTTYGGSLINQKYTPLANTTVDDVALLALMEGRNKVLREKYAFPSMLTFISNPKLVPGAPSALPPMFVHSSNRAQWIKSLFDNLDVVMQERQNLEGYTDPSTFGPEGTRVPVPWYAPQRSGNRHVYIVVHWSEYKYYANALNSVANVTVVGFRFTPVERFSEIVGFGVSRFAAVQLAKSLNCGRAWTVDDNVININGFPQLLSTVEDKMTNDIWAIGFTGATEIQTDLKQITLAENNLTLTETSFLQQVLFWDIRKLEKLNISPLFLTSHEDSVCKFVDRRYSRDGKSRPIQLIKACKIMKFQPDPPSCTSGTMVGYCRALMLDAFDAVEGQTRVNENTTLSEYIRKTVLPNCQDRTINPLVAQSMAVEQLLDLGAATCSKPLLQPAFSYAPQVSFAVP